MALSERKLKRRTQGVFAHSTADVWSVAAALAHATFVVLLVVGFARRPLSQNLVLGAVYAYLRSWNINSVSHNFIHTPYFRWAAANHAFSVLESLAIGFSQTFYRWIHLRHHQGNSDRLGPDGTTIDWLSIYRHGRAGEPEDVVGYALKSFFRGDLADVYRALRLRNRFDAELGRTELAAFALCVVAGLWWNWRAVLFLVPFYYLGECLSSLNGYYEHFGGNPDEPIAWGVSSYTRFYNFAWFNNGHHAEHHAQPGLHWRRLPALRREIEPEQRAKRVHVIGTAHALGFLARANRRRFCRAADGSK